MALPLPYRPLEVRGHGVYDPETGNFYPFTSASGIYTGAIVTGRKYWYLYVYCVIVSGQNSGDRGAGYCEVVAGYGLVRINLGATSAAAATSSAMAIATYPNVLILPNTNIAFDTGAAAGKAVVIYAAIPDDGGGK